MKPLRFGLFISLFITVTSNAQNWSLVMPNDTLVYEKQDNHQFFTVWVDSTHVNGTDTTYFMNRVIPESNLGLADSSDYCHPFLWGSSPAYRTKSSGFHSFGSKVQSSISKSFVWYGLKKVVIYPKKPVGSSWVCDSTTMDSMRIVSVDTAFLDLFQTIDSVKILEYKNKNIILSKNYGVLSGLNFQDSNQYAFQITGVQNLNIGEIIPMAKDIYDFEIGDIFFRKKGGGDSDEFREITSKTRILSKTIIADTVYYSVQVNSQLYTYSPQWGDPHYYPKQQYNTTLSYALNYPNELLNTFPGNLSRVIDQYWGVDMLSNTIVYRNNSNQIEKRNGSFNSWINVQGICEYDSFLVHQYIHGSAKVYIKNLGKVEDVYRGGLQMGSDNLIGYIKANGETWGNTTFTSVSEIDYSQFIKIYPNPVKDFITIETEKLSGSQILEMYDLQGRLIVAKTFEARLKLDVSNWSNGIYFTVIRDENGAVIYREKVVVQ